MAIGDTGMTEIESHASSPVRAVLLDADGNTVARAAARPDDWNFLLSGHVAPGRYRLRVEPIATPALRVGLVMRSRVEIEEHPVTLPLDRQLDPGDAVHVLPLEIPRGAELLAVTLASRENVGCALERREGEAWRLLASAVGRSPRVAVALDPAHALPVRLRVWSIDGRGEALRAQAAAAGRASPARGRPAVRDRARGPQGLRSAARRSHRGSRPPGRAAAPRARGRSAAGRRRRAGADAERGRAAGRPRPSGVPAR